MRTRARWDTIPVRNTERVRIGLGQPFTEFFYNAEFVNNRQVTVDESHGNFQEILSEARAFERETGMVLSTQSDVGGPFQTTRYEYTDGGQDANFHVGTTQTTIERDYHGRRQAYSYNFPSWPPIAYIDQTLLWAYGNKASSLVNPANPVTRTGVGAGELREVQGIPGIPGVQALKERARIFKGLGHEYLNVEFGWLPFESDLKRAAATAKKTIHLLRQYERNRGKAVRRRFSFPDVETFGPTHDMGSATSQPPINSAFYQGGHYNGKLSMTEYFNQKTWFSGSFTYYVSPGLSPGKLSAYEAAANRLLGTRLTPDLVWSLTPWTWLTDWFVDIGSIFRDLDARILDGSVMWYGYVMATQKRSYTYTLSGTIPYNRNSAVDLYQIFSATTKQRVKATPFGFGLTPNRDFSMKQWTILAALGITKV